MSLFGLKSKEGAASINLPHHDGVPNFPKGWASELTLLDDQNKLEIRARIGKYPPVYLQYNQIVGVTRVSEKEIIEKGKSVLGRAVVGEVLLGPFGALVGGMSGIGNKTKTNTKIYVIINYKPSNDESNEDIKVISFEDNTVMNAGKFINMLKERAGLINKEMPAEVNL